MKPGAYWIVEIDGRLTIGQVVEGLSCGSDVTRWKFAGDAPERLIQVSDPAFRAFRWIDVEGMIDRPAPILPVGLPPQPGEFWLIEYHGNITVGKLARDGDVRLWELPGYAGEQREEGGTFRPVRRIDVATLMDFIHPSPDQLDRHVGAVDPETVPELRALLGEARRIIWFLAKQAGGSVSIDGATLETFDPIQATVTVWPADPVTGGIRIEADSGEAKANERG